MALNFSNIWFSKKKKKSNNPPWLSAVKSSVTNLLHQSWQGGRQCCLLAPSDFWLLPGWRVSGGEAHSVPIYNIPVLNLWSQSTQQMKFLEGHHVIWMVVKTHTMMGVKRVCPQAVRGHLAKEELESEFSVTVLLLYWQWKRWSNDRWHKYFC